MKDNADGVPHAGSQAAHTVAEIHAIVALRTLHWPVVNCKGHSIPLSKWHDLDPALHPRPLLRQNELAAREILAGL